MTSNVWNLPRSIKSLHGAITLFNKNKKLLLGIAGIASVAAFMYFRNKRDDAPVFQKKLVAMNAMEEQAVNQMKRIPYSDMSEAAGLIKDSTLPIWQTFQQQVAGTASLSLDEGLEAKRHLLVDYAALRIQQAQLLYSALNENTNAYDEQLNSVHERINAILDQLQY